MAEPQKPREIKCPQCGRLTLYTEANPFRPFCSERCRTMDLGAWASETYKIPAPPSSSDSLSSLPDEEDDLSDDDY